MKHLETLFNLLLFPFLFLVRFSLSKDRNIYFYHKKLPRKSIFIFFAAFLFLPNILSASTTLANDKFTSNSADGYSRDDGSTKRLQIKGEKISSKTYDFTSTYANASVTVTFKVWWKGDWDNGRRSHDDFEVMFNGSNVIDDKKSGDGDQSYTKTTTLDSDGKLKIEFYAHSNKSEEYLQIDNVKIVTDFTPNTDPVVDTPISDQTNNEGDSITSLDVSGNFSDPDGDTLTFSATGLPGTLSISNSGTITGTIDSDANDNSPYSVTVTANDGNGGTVSDTFTWTINAISSNTDPVVDTPISDQTNNEGDTITSLDVSGNFSDPDGDTLTFSATGLPGTLSISNSGTITGTVDSDANDNSPYSVTVTANDGNGGTVSDEFIWTVNIVEDFVDNADDLCYEYPPEYSGSMMGLPTCISIGDGLFKGGMNCTQTITIRNQNRDSLTDVTTGLGITGFSGSMFSDCGIDGTSGNCSEESWAAFGPMNMFNRGVAFDPMPDYNNPNETHTIYTKSLMSMAFFSGNNLVGAYSKNGVTYRGVINKCEPRSYCETHNLNEGFNLIDPDGGNDKNTFEIFCHYEDATETWHDLLALPIKNDSNNFKFNSETTSSNYYNITDNPRTHFHAIKINGNYITYDGEKPIIPVATEYSKGIWDINTNGSPYSVLGTEFSNINLIGTPFKIDWGRTADLSECNEAKLRKGLGQAVKYNTINGTNNVSNDGKSICGLNSLTLTLLDDYRFLTYQGTEVMQHSCKEMAEYIPNNIGILDDASVAGHFNILTSEPHYETGTPTTNGTRDNGTDIGARTTDGAGTANKRPITVYCKYQTDLSYVWTFLTALDAKVTQYKSDLTNHSDTCSELGLFFYVPNTKTTFDRVRNYLKNQKTGVNGWENYTGTIEEKIQALHSGNIYYLPNFKDVKIWPYGPFGVYKDAGSANNPRALMKSDDTGSMGILGWKSILGPNDLNVSTDGLDHWWISDIGAGLEITKPTGQHTYEPSGGHPTRTNTYDEPNGNYSHGAWLNFLYDNEGWVYHLDDWNANYPYYDYMCMSETNYDPAYRYALIPGFFNAIERGTRTGNATPNFSDDKLTTQIVNKRIDLDVILYAINTSNGTINKNALNTDENKSVGIFLASINEDSTLSLIQKIGEYENFDTYNGRIELSGFTIPVAVKKAIIKFYYCNDAASSWDTCWQETNNPLSVQSISGGGTSDSYDLFSIRPKEFLIADGNTSTAKKIAGETYNLTLRAVDNNDADVSNYNESVSIQGASPLLDYNETNPNCKIGNMTFTSSDINFTNGAASIAFSYDEVGDLSISLLENSGTEYAKEDFNDTDFSSQLDDSTLTEPTGSEIYREISPATITLSFIPDHFKIDATLSDHKVGKFTYLSKDLNMSTELNITVTAENRLNTTTENYNDSCYAKPIDLNISSVYSPVDFTPNSLDKMLYILDANDSTYTKKGNETNISKSSIADINKTVFPSGDYNGTAKLRMKLNFNRKRNEPVNPFEMNITAIDVTDIDSVNGTNAPDSNATFFFARAKSSKFFYDDVSASSINTPISVVVYCDTYPTCSQLGTNIQTSGKINEPYWWLSLDHNEGSNDGNITLLSPPGILAGGSGNSPTVTTDVNITSGAIDSSIIVSRGGTNNLPMTVGIKLDTTPTTDTNSWLIYNPASNVLNPDPFYKVRFIGTMDWAGHGDTGHVVNTDTSTKKNKKLGW